MTSCSLPATMDTFALECVSFWRAALDPSRASCTCKEEKYPDLRLDHVPHEEGHSISTQGRRALNVLLQSFVEHNFTGITESMRTLHLCERCYFPVHQDFTEKDLSKLRSWLSLDGETVCPVLSKQHYLFLLWIGVKNFSSELGPHLRLRISMLYQRCLSHRSHTLYTAIKNATKEIIEAGNVSISFSEARAETLVEVANALHYYGDHTEMQNILFKAAKYSNLVFEEAVLVGVRTRWQEFQTAQLVVEATSSTNVSRPENGTWDCATNVKDLNKELPLEIEGEGAGHDLYTRPRNDTTSCDGSVENLLPVHNAILLAFCADIEKENPVHELTTEKMDSYVQRVLANPTHTWILKAMSLLLRSRGEEKRTRVAQRSLLQLQQLADEFTSDPQAERANGFFLTQYPSYHALRYELAGRYFSENLYKTALEYFEQLHAWDKIVLCSLRLERRNSVELLARRALEKGCESVDILVALGIATHDETSLSKAWKQSNFSHAGAARALARHHLSHKDFEQAIEYFDECIRLNPSFGGDWFVLGYAALRLSDWSRAAEAFTRVCQMEPENGWGWNNLSMTLMTMKKFRPAYHALSQAVKFNEQSWQVWENFFTVSVKLKETDSALRGLRKLVDLGGRQAELDDTTLSDFGNHVYELLSREGDGELTMSEDDSNTHHCDDVRPVIQADDKIQMECTNLDSLLCEFSDVSQEKHTNLHRYYNLPRINLWKTKYEDLLEEIVSFHPFSEKICKVASDFHYKVGNWKNAADYNLAHVRACQKENWQHDTKKALCVLDAVDELLILVNKLKYRKWENVAAFENVAKRRASAVLETTRVVHGKLSLWEQVNTRLNAVT